MPAIDDNVDDMRIYVRLDSIDGPGGILGGAAYCFFRVSNQLPLVGFMQFDTADLAQLEFNGSLPSIIVHEMGHALGIGTAWRLAELLRDPSLVTPGADTYFDGPLAIAAFDAAGGTGYSGAKVPVANEGDAGRADGHWRESVMNVELMTPFIDFGVEPLSAISIQSLADVGYRVDVSKADAFSFSPFNAAPGRRRGPVIDLSNDIMIGPIIGVDAQGGVKRVIRR